MALRLVSPLWLALAALVLGGCGDDRPEVPNAPVNGGSSIGNGDDRDGGPLPIKDAGPPRTDAGDGAVPATSCERIEVVRSVAEDTPGVTSTSAPRDFLVSRQAERWSPDCINPKLIIELSDGLCPNGFGHQLALAFSLNDFRDGALHVGNNAVLPDAESTSIQVRYTRPEPLEPSGVWGSCLGSSGQVVFIEAPDPTAGSTLRAQYALELTPCNSETTAPMQTVIGVFTIQLRYELSEFCPTRSM